MPVEKDALDVTVGAGQIIIKCKGGFLGVPLEWGNDLISLIKSSSIQAAVDTHLSEHARLCAQTTNE